MHVTFATRVAISVLALGICPLRAAAECSELQILAAERAQALYLTRTNIKELVRQIGLTTDEVEREILESQRVSSRAEHKAIVGNIEENGRRLWEECQGNG